MVTSRDPTIALDVAALKLLRSDIEALSDHQLALPTPCTGWDVAALLNHMATEHDAICGSEMAPSESDPRQRWIRAADRWLDFMQAAGDDVYVPKMGTKVTLEQLVAVHFADMLIHRWDLAAATGQPCETPEVLLAAANQIADLVTSPGSPLVGPNGVYRPALTEDSTATPLENLVRRYGRDHAWRAPIG
jgi:uncharacterized protein (TIGR03086 family)